MASTKAPLFGLDASGSLGTAIVFSKWRGRTYVRKHSVPANPRSGLQMGMRASMKFITQDWTNLSVSEKASWDDLAAVDNITQLNAMVRYDQERVRRNLGLVRFIGAPPFANPNAPINLATTQQPKTLVLDWDDPAANPGNYTAMIYGSATMGFVADISNLIAIVPVAIETYTWIGLKTGVQMFWRVRQANAAGELGALSVEDSGTPL